MGSVRKRNELLISRALREQRPPRSRAEGQAFTLDDNI